MADLKAQFQQAAKDVMGLAERPDNDTMLRLYALPLLCADGVQEQLQAGQRYAAGQWISRKGMPVEEGL